MEEGKTDVKKLLGMDFEKWLEEVELKFLATYVKENALVKVANPNPNRKCLCQKGERRIEKAGIRGERHARRSWLRFN